MKMDEIKKLNLLWAMIFSPNEGESRNAVTAIANFLNAHNLRPTDLAIHPVKTDPHLLELLMNQLIKNDKLIEEIEILRCENGEWRRRYGTSKK